MRECACSRITNNYICGTCTAELAGYLHRTPWLISELETTAARLDKTSSGGNLESKTASKSRPDTVNLNATLAAQELLFLRMKFGGDAGRAALDPDGPEHYTRFEQAYKRGIRIIDVKVGRTYLGICPTEGCEEHLNVSNDETAHKCHGCGETLDIEAHTTERLEAGFKVVHYPPEIVAAIRKMGQRVTVGDIRNWKDRGKLAPAGEDEAGRKFYRVNDVWKLVAARAGVPERTPKRTTSM